MFQATRRRLAIWYTMVTAVLLLLFASGVYYYVRNTLIERIDDTLKHVVEIVDRSLVIEQVTPDQGTYQVKIEASFRNKAEAVEDDHIDIEWFNPSGQLIWSTFAEPLSIPLITHPTGKTVYLSSDRLLRQVTKKIEFGRYTLGYLRVSHPWFEVTKPIKKLIRDLSIGISIMVICVAAIGWLLSGIAIQPVRDSYQSLKQFTADASHELRNPIAMIQTNIQMALAYPETDPKIQEQQLKIVERLTQRLGNLVNDLLFLARSDSGTIQINYQPVPLDALLIEVIEEQRLIAQQKGIFLSLHLVNSDNNKEDIFTVKGDWDQLARLFTNLISNALEHSKIKEEEEMTVEVILELLKKDHLQVKIKDKGQGISQNALPHIFDRFYRVDPARSHIKSKGTGLGLAIAQAITNNHNGHISVESQLNFGTTFTVTLPLYSVI